MVHSKHYQERKTAGLCPLCGGERGDTGVLCLPCRKVRRERGISWYRANPKRWRELHRQRAYNLTPEDFTLLVQQQGGRCAICGRAGDLAVDHCHTTGAVRGLLCRKCNAGIGLLGDDATTVLRAWEYLQAGGVNKKEGG